MSWITGLAGKAEDFLNKVDKSAATALSPEQEKWKAQQQNTAGYSPYLGSTVSSAAPSTSPATPSNAMISSSSVPSNLNNAGGAGTYGNSQMSRSLYSTTPVSSGKQSPATLGNSGNGKNKIDKDEELFEFLNSSDTVDGRRKVAKNGKHSRQSSISSTTSSRSAKTPDPGSQASGSAPISSTGEDRSEGAGVEHDAGEDAALIQDSSSGYHSSQEDSSQTSELEMENRLLRNEVSSLSQEMTSVIHRAKTTQEELQQVKSKLASQNRQLTTSDQIVRELQSRENDLQESLQAKDSQLAVLRVRFEEADKELAEKCKRLSSIETENQRILQDHTSSSGVQSQALDSLREKLVESESLLRVEQEKHLKSQQYVDDKQTKFEMEQQKLSQALAVAQKKLNEEKSRVGELTTQVKTAKNQYSNSQQEMTNYKEKATRILQSKDKLISGLKDGGASLSGDSGVSVAELEQVRQEKDLLREEMHKAQMTIEALHSDISELEDQLSQEVETARDTASGLEEQLATEHQRLQDAEHEVKKHTQELKYAHEELIKQKTSLQNRIQDREQEIERLRNQLTTKSMSTSSQVELENRLHALTESLIHKQTMLEALSTEKNSLGLQLERMEKQYREAEASALRATTTVVNVHEDDDSMRHRTPGFMRESPQDNDVTRRVKRAADTIDRFSMRLGVFLRRYPIARVFVIVYMFLLHLWVMIVLLTYQPEMHGMDYHPKAPE